jgi:hypothetical protein
LPAAAAGAASSGAMASAAMIRRTPCDCFRFIVHTPYFVRFRVRRNPRQKHCPVFATEPVCSACVPSWIIPSIFFGKIREGISEMLGTLLIVVLLLLLLGAWPSWPYSRGWGYYPSSALGLVLVIVLVLAVMGQI